MNIKQLKLYAVVTRGSGGRLEVQTCPSKSPALMVYATRNEAISARVEEASGAKHLLDAWQIVSFSADGLMTTKPKKKLVAGSEEPAPDGGFAVLADHLVGAPKKEG